MLLSTASLSAQNSIVGDGFGGRLWYKPSNYTVGSYSAYTICGDSCGANNQLYGWGANQYGQLGNGTSIGSVSPVEITGMTNVRYYSTGYVMGAIKNDNTAWVWGTGIAGYGLASGFTTSPQQVLTDVKFLDASMTHIAFVKNDGTVWSVGRNNGCFGNGSISSGPFTTPIQMTGITNAVRVAAGGVELRSQIYVPFTIVLLSDGIVKQAWSDNNAPLYTATTVNGLSNIVDIKANSYCGYALSSSGKVYSWGNNWAFGFGITGIPKYTIDFTAHEVIFPSDAKSIVAISACSDGYSTFALDEGGNVYSWGGLANLTGVLGNGNYEDQIEPALVATNVADIMTGETFSYIIKTDGSLWATGRSGFSSSGSIWMNLSNITRNVFTQINPLIAPMNLCKPIAQYTAFAQATDATCTNGGTITVTHTGGKAPYTYSIGNDYQNSNIFTNLSAGNYTVSVKDSVGCTSTVLTTVGSSTNSITNLFKTITNATCSKNNGAVNLTNVTGGVAPYQYNFNNSSFSSATNYPDLSPGNYSIVVKDSNGCNYTTTAIVNNIGVPSSASITDTICGGRIYNFNGTNLTVSGNYKDTLTNAADCDSIINLQLTVTPTPVIHLGKDTILCVGDTLRLDVTTQNATYVWQDGSTLPYYIVTQDGQYHVNVKTNCIDAVDTIEVKYKSCEAINCTYFIPTAFSPNGDGNNDEFKIRSNCNLTGMLIIYNRLGNEIFKTTDLTIGWNGKYKGESLQADVYAYYAEFALNGKIEKRKGNITLLK